MWLVDWLRDFLPSCLKGGDKETIITKLTDKNNVNIAGNSTQDNTGVAETKQKQSVEKAFGADNLKRRKIVSNQSDKIKTNNDIQDDINDLNVSMIQINNNEDSFKEPDDEKESSFFKWIMQTNNEEEQNTNCNNDGNIRFTLNNVSLNDTTSLNQ